MTNFMKMGDPEHTIFETPTYPFNIFDVKNATTMAHWHDHSEFIWIQSGECQIVVNDHKLACEMGDVVFVAPGCLHSMICSKGHYVAFVVGDTLLRELRFDQDTDVVLNRVLSGVFGDYNYFNNDGRWDNVKKGLLAIYKEFQVKTEGYKMMVKINLCTLLLEIYRSAEPQKIHTQPITSVEYVKVVLSFIDDHFHEKITLAQISDFTHISQQHFARIFKAYTGRTFIDYLTLYRLNIGRWYLKNTDVPITRIPDKIGFCNANYFARVYKEQYGTSPSTTRKLGSSV